MFRDTLLTLWRLFDLTSLSLFLSCPPPYSSPLFHVLTVLCDQGEEMCDCYIDLRQSRVDRQEELQQSYRFLCTCKACLCSDRYTNHNINLIFLFIYKWVSLLRCYSHIIPPFYLLSDFLILFLSFCRSFYSPSVQDPVTTTRLACLRVSSKTRASLPWSEATSMKHWWLHNKVGMSIVLLLLLLLLLLLWCLYSLSPYLYVYLSTLTHRYFPLYCSLVLPALSLSLKVWNCSNIQITSMRGRYAIVQVTPFLSLLLQSYSSSTTLLLLLLLLLQLLFLFLPSSNPSYNVIVTHNSIQPSSYPDFFYLS